MIEASPVMLGQSMRSPMAKLWVFQVPVFPLALALALVFDPANISLVRFIAFKTKNSEFRESFIS